MISDPITVPLSMPIKSSGTMTHINTAQESSDAAEQIPSATGYATEYAKKAIGSAWVEARLSQDLVSQAPGSAGRLLTSRGKKLVSHTSTVNVHALGNTSAAANTLPSVEIIHAEVPSAHEPAKIIHAPATIVQAPEFTVQGGTAPSTVAAADISRLAEQVCRVIEGKITREKEKRGM